MNDRNGIWSWPGFVDTSIFWKEDVTMPKLRPRYPTVPPGFRRKLIDLVRAGSNPEELARQFEPTGQTIRNWAADTRPKKSSGS